MIAILRHREKEETRVLLLNDFLTFSHSDFQRLEKAGWEISLHPYSYAHKWSDVGDFVRKLELE